MIATRKKDRKVYENEPRGLGLPALQRRDWRTGSDHRLRQAVERAGQGRGYSSLAMSQEETQPSETALLTASPLLLTSSLP